MPRHEVPLGDDELLRDLSAALAPEPMPARLMQRVRRDLDRRTARRRLDWRRITGSCLAAAASVALLFAWKPLIEAPAVAELTPAEARELVSALALLRWDNPLQPAVDEIEKKIEQLHRTIDQPDGSGTLLPWGPTDNWDEPDATTPPAGRPSRTVKQPALI